MRIENLTYETVQWIAIAISGWIFGLVFLYGMMGFYRLWLKECEKRKEYFHKIVELMSEHGTND